MAITAQQDWAAKSGRICQTLHKRNHDFQFWPRLQVNEKWDWGTLEFYRPDGSGETYYNHEELLQDAISELTNRFESRTSNLENYRFDPPIHGEFHIIPHLSTYFYLPSVDLWQNSPPHWLQQAKCQLGASTDNWCLDCQFSKSECAISITPSPPCGPILVRRSSNVRSTTRAIIANEHIIQLSITHSTALLTSASAHPISS